MNPSEFDTLTMFVVAAMAREQCYRRLGQACRHPKVGSRCVPCICRALVRVADGELPRKKRRR